MILEFQVYNVVYSDGKLRSGDVRRVAVLATAIQAIEAPLEDRGGLPDEKSVPQLHVRGSVYLLAEPWERAVERWRICISHDAALSQI